MEGHEGHIQPEQHRQQRHFIEAPGHEADVGIQQPHIEHHRNPDGETGVDAQRHHRDHEAVDQVGQHLPERHPTQPCANLPADGDLCQQYEFIEPDGFDPAQRVQHQRHQHRTEQMRHGHADQPRQRVAAEGHGEELDDPARRQLEQPGQIVLRLIGLLDRRLSFDQREDQGRAQKDEGHPYEVREDDGIVLVNVVPGDDRDLCLPAGDRAEQSLQPRSAP